MATKVSYLDKKKILVETSQGENYIIGFKSEINYLSEVQANIPFTDFVSSLFDRYYKGDDTVIMGEISRQLILHNFENVFFVQKDVIKERVLLGERIKEIRQAKGIDAKTLACKAGIDAANLCRIEQGKYSPGLDVLSKIGYAMGMKLDFVEIQ